ncbi:phosphatidate cytidylyltransferase [Pseudokordiimonas caeni]|uniref:phosphatidate cytidylyltransferase n=1 Tax=Pseudokordiimonas caeni TaxID=2997908 RepID=UPI00281239C6|nr:phosphatidate cytidylyltransferase [Pseudokordiimonas caeni]
MPLGLSDNLFKRIVAALALLPPVLGAVWAGGLWFDCLLILGAALMAFEWAGLTLGGSKVAGALVLLPVAMLILFSTPVFAAVEGVALLAVLAIGGWLLATKGQGAAGRIGWWAAGIGYVGAPIFALDLIRKLPEGFLTVIFVFLLVWATDVGGYFFGKGIGGPKLAPVISPKKTWAGLLGGMLLAGAVGAAIAAITAWHSPMELGLLAAGLAVVAQIGDLFESAVKRRFGAKDSGNLIPGHGGILDRVDGIVFAAPAAALYFHWAASGIQ